MSGPATTEAEIVFMGPVPDGGAWHNINLSTESGERDRNYERETHQVTIHNIRGKEDTASLDVTGFQFYERPSKHKLFTNDIEIEKEYYPESIELIKELTGASRAVIFDHTVRRRRPGILDDDPSRRQPVANAHVDQTTNSSIARVQRHLPPEDVERLLSKRFQIINLWRPISHPAYDWPLALADYRTVDAAKNTHPIMLFSPGRKGETLGVQYNENQKWYYQHGMKPEEIVLIKCFDSVQDGSVAVFTPHTGFEDPKTPPDAPFRESIELRFFVFYD